MLAIPRSGLEPSSPARFLFAIVLALLFRISSCYRELHTYIAEKVAPPEKGCRSMVSEYEMLHTQSKEYIVNDILEVILLCNRKPGFTALATEFRLWKRILPDVDS